MSVSQVTNQTPPPKKKPRRLLLCPPERTEERALSARESPLLRLSLDQDRMWKLWVLLAHWLAHTGAHTDTLTRGSGRKTAKALIFEPDSRSGAVDSHSHKTSKMR